MVKIGAYYYLNLYGKIRQLLILQNPQIGEYQTLITIMVFFIWVSLCSTLHDWFVSQMNIFGSISYSLSEVSVCSSKVCFNSVHYEDDIIP